MPWLGLEADRITANGKDINQAIIDGCRAPYAAARPGLFPNLLSGIGIDGVQKTGRRAEV